MDMWGKISGANVVFDNFAEMTAAMLGAGPVTLRSRPESGKGLLIRSPSGKAIKIK
jgi:hypothetical protein